MVPPASHRIPRVLWYSGVRLSAQVFAYRAFTVFGSSFQRYSTDLRFNYADPTTPTIRRCSVWPLTVSLAATQVIEFSFFSSGYLDVSVHRVPSIQLCICCTVTCLPHAGFPHSDIRGSMPVCGSPQLFAAYHVLHRRLAPGHPPCALISLIFAPAYGLLFPYASDRFLLSLFSCFFYVRFSRCVRFLSYLFHLSILLILTIPQNDTHTKEITCSVRWHFVMPAS